MASILLIAPEFHPVNTSAAIQLFDLSKEIVRQGNSILVITPDSNQKNILKILTIEGVKVLKIKSINTKSSSYFLRTLAEFFTPYWMIIKLRGLPKAELSLNHFSGIIWYSPSIFFVPIVKYFKKKFKCPAYLILRDIFPQWAVDLGLLKKGIVYFIFKYFEGRQYKYADIIGVQSKGNFDYFLKNYQIKKLRIEFLQNWLSEDLSSESQNKTNFLLPKNKKIFVYAGNMGIAQGLEIILYTARKISYRSDLFFLFIGRGSEVKNLKKIAADLSIKNILFLDEIPCDQLPSLFRKCHYGIVCLDERHKTHNIPGKFITYLKFNLPVLAVVNSNNDLINIIRSNLIGEVTSEYSIDVIEQSINMLARKELYKNYKSQCQKLFYKSYLTKVVASKILKHF